MTGTSSAESTHARRGAAHVSVRPRRVRSMVAAMLGVAVMGASSVAWGASIEPTAVADETPTDRRSDLPPEEVATGEPILDIRASVSPTAPAASKEGTAAREAPGGATSPGTPTFDPRLTLAPPRGVVAIGVGSALLTAPIVLSPLWFSFPSTGISPGAITLLSMSLVGGASLVTVGGIRHRRYRRWERAQLRLQSPRAALHGSARSPMPPVTRATRAPAMPRVETVGWTFEF